MLQDIDQTFDKTYKHLKPKDKDYVLIFGHRTFLARKEGEETLLPTFAQVRKDVIYLFSLDEKRYFLCLESLELEGYDYYFVSELKFHSPKEISFIVMNGYHIWDWMKRNRYCGMCGKETHLDDKELMLACSCGNCIYPRINPAVNIAIIDGNKLLLARHKRHKKAPYSLLAGFVEYGETLEDTVKREVLEEVGLQVKNITYFASQPWGVAGNLQVGYFCELDGSNDVTVQEDELLDAVWFEREDIPEEISLNSITGTMIYEFKYKKGN